MPQPHLPVASEISRLTTEQRDPSHSDIDLLTLKDRCALQNRIDSEVAAAVALEVGNISQAVGLIVTAFRSGGRLIYVGAGTSGRLGVLDAAECPPTFGTPPELVQAIIAGGAAALTQAVEGAEDDQAAGAAAISAKEVIANDCVVGITASGRTPFVLAALEEARRRGAATVGITNNSPSEIEQYSQPTIAVLAGPELIAGSTRLKCGTAQKLVLNMLTTQSMIEIGKTYGNAMVDVMATNAKLRIRANHLVQELTGAGDDEAQQALAAAGGSAKLATLMLLREVNARDASEMLDKAHGKLRDALFLV